MYTPDEPCLASLKTTLGSFTIVIAIPPLFQPQSRSQDVERDFAFHAVLLISDRKSYAFALTRSSSSCHRIFPASLYSLCLEGTKRGSQVLVMSLKFVCTLPFQRIMTVLENLCCPSFSGCGANIKPIRQVRKVLKVGREPQNPTCVRPSKTRSMRIHQQDSTLRCNIFHLLRWLSSLRGTLKAPEALPQAGNRSLLPPNMETATRRRHAAPTINRTRTKYGLR